MLDGKFERKFRQVQAARRVSGGDTGKIGRHVGKNDVDLCTVKQSLERLLRCFFAEIALDERHVGQRFHRQDVQRDDASLH